MRWITLTSLYPSRAFPAHGTFVRERLRAVLAATAGEATVVAPIPWFPFPRGFGEWSRNARVPRFEADDGLGVHHPRYPFLPRVSEPIHPLLYAAGAWPTLRRVRAGARLLDAHYLYPDGVAAAKLARRLGLPLVLTARGSDVNLLTRRRIPRAWIRRALRSAAAVVAVSEGLRRTLAAETGHPAERIEVIPNGVDPTRFRPGDRDEARARLDLPGEATILLGAGRLAGGKRFDVAVRALDRLDGKTRLLLVGDGPGRPALEALVRRAGLDGRVRFAGERRPEEMPVHYQAADLLVHPSDREGHPNVVLEALACGIPVVASRVGGIPETVGEGTGELVDANEPEAFARAIERTLSRPPERSALLRRAGAFTWASVGERVAEVFRRAAAGA